MSEELIDLRQCPVFAPLAPDEAQALASTGLSCQYGQQDTIYVPTDCADSLLLLTTGRVKIFNVSMTGKEMVLAFIEPGDLFGHSAVVDFDRREEYAQAVDTSTVLRIPSGEVRRTMAVRPEVALGVIRMVASRLTRVERRLENLLIHPARGRLIHALLDLAEQHRRTTPYSAHELMTLRFTHQDLANLIGTSRETTSGILSQLQREGYLDLGRQRIILKDVDRLARSVTQQ